MSRSQKLLVTLAIVVYVAILTFMLWRAVIPEPERDTAGNLSLSAGNLSWHVGRPKEPFPDGWVEIGGETNTLDGLYERLDHLHAQYNWPKRLPFGRSTEILFLIEGDRGESGDNLIATFPGDPVKINIKAADQMSATLTAPESDAVVTPRSAELQPVTHVSTTKWIWDVEPKRPGTVILTLDVYARLQFKAKNRSIPDTDINVLARRIEIPIDVTLWDQTTILFAEIDPVWKTGAMILSGIAAVLWFFGLRRKEKDYDT